MADDQQLPDGAESELSEERRRDVDEFGRRAGAALRGPAPPDGVTGIARRARNQRIVRVAGVTAGAGALLVGVLVIINTGDPSGQQRPTDVSTGRSASATDLATTTTGLGPVATTEPVTTVGSTTTVASPALGTLDFRMVGSIDGAGAAAYGADGSVLAVSSAGGVIRFFDPESLTLQRELACPTGESLRDDLGVDLEWLPVVAATWDAESRGLLTAMSSSLPTLSECPMVFSTDGSRAARSARTLAKNEYESTIWDTGDGRVVAVVPGGSPEFSPDGSTLVTEGLGSIRVWDVTTGTQLAEFQPFSSGQSVFAEYSPDGSRIAGWGGTDVVIWDAHTYAELRRLTPPRTTYYVSFNSDSTRIATANFDSGSVWDTATGEELMRLPGTGGELLQVVFSPNDALIAAGGLRPVSVFDAVTGDELAQVGGTSEIPGGFVAFSPDGATLALSMVNGRGVWQWRYS